MSSQGGSRSSGLPRYLPSVCIVKNWLKKYDKRIINSFFYRKWLGWSMNVSGVQVFKIVFLTFRKCTQLKARCILLLLQILCNCQNSCILILIRILFMINVLSHICCCVKPQDGLLCFSDHLSATLKNMNWYIRNHTICLWWASCVESKRNLLVLCKNIIFVYNIVIFYFKFFLKLSLFL